MLRNLDLGAGWRRIMPLSNGGWVYRKTSGHYALSLHDYSPTNVQWFVIYKDSYTSVDQGSETSWEAALEQLQRYIV
jgi:hypothetical protein